MSVSTAQVTAVLDRVPTGALVGGDWIQTTDRLAVENPATTETLLEVADADAELGRQALDAAVGAQSAWAATDPRQRGEILRKAFEIVTGRADDFALLMTLEMGKPLAEARGKSRTAPSSSAGSPKRRSGSPGVIRWLRPGGPAC